MAPPTLPQHTTRRAHFRAQFVPNSPRQVSVQVPTRPTGSPISSPLRQAVRKHFPVDEKAVALSFIGKKKEREVLLGVGKVFEDLKETMKAKIDPKMMRLEGLIEASAAQIKVLGDKLELETVAREKLEQELQDSRMATEDLEGKVKEGEEAREQMERDLKLLTTERNDYVRDSKDALLVGAFRFLAKSLLDKSSHEPTSTLKHHILSALERPPTKLRDDLRANPQLRHILTKRAVRMLADSCDIDKRNSESHPESHPASLVLSLSKLEDLAVSESKAGAKEGVESLALKLVLGVMGPSTAKEIYGELLERSCPPSQGQQERVSKYLAN